MTSKHDGSPTWGEIYWAWKKRGAPPEEAAFRADEAMRKQEKERDGHNAKRDTDKAQRNQDRADYARAALCRAKAENAK